MTQNDFKIKVPKFLVDFIQNAIFFFLTGAITLLCLFTKMAFMNVNSRSTLCLNLVFYNLHDVIFGLFYSILGSNRIETRCG